MFASSYRVDIDLSRGLITLDKTNTGSVNALVSFQYCVLSQVKIHQYLPCDGTQYPGSEFKIVYDILTRSLGKYMTNDRVGQVVKQMTNTERAISPISSPAAWKSQYSFKREPTNGSCGMDIAQTCSAACRDGFM